jgi:hypothetical protein
VYPFERLTANEAQHDFSEVWQTAKTALPALTDEQLALVVSLVVDTCPYCHERNRDCACWNDE